MPADLSSDLRDCPLDEAVLRHAFPLVPLCELAGPMHGCECNACCESRLDELEAELQVAVA